MRHERRALKRRRLRGERERVYESVGVCIDTFLESVSERSSNLMATYRAARVGVNVDPASAPRFRNTESREASFTSCKILFFSLVKESRAVHASDAFRRKSSARHRPHAMATRVFRDGDELV